MSELPTGWAEGTVAGLAGAGGLVTDGDWIESKDQDPSGKVRLIQLADIGDGDFRDRSSRFVTQETARRLSCTYLEQGDILVARMPDPLGRACIFPGLSQPAITAVDVLVWRGQQDGPNARWLTHAINSPEVREAIARQAGGTTRQRISGGRLKQLVVPVPPLSEQRRIVAKIESLKGKAKRARGHLDHVCRLVEKYKQAVLAAAFRGDLTREWRHAHTSFAPSLETLARQRAYLLNAHRHRLSPCEATSVSKTEQPFELPSDWTWVRAEAICGFITKGTTPQSALMSPSDGEIPYIKVYNLTFDGSLDFTIEPTFVSSATHEGFLARSKVFPGDVLMNIVGPPLGKVSVVPNERPEWNINQAIAVFRPVPSVLTAFLSKWLLTDVLTRWAVFRSKATAGQRNLTLEICRDLPVPLCSTEEQLEIVRHINNAMRWINRLASEATSARKLVDRLDQAVLAKAFRGELVPQDPADEPASVLLERIRAGGGKVKARRG